MRSSRARRDRPNLASNPTKSRNPDSSSDVGINQHKPAKRSRDRIPPPQRARILQHYIAGKSVAEISSEENRNRETVTRIVRSDEMREYVIRTREAFYGLGDSAIAALRHALEKKRDGNLAYKILTDLGVVPTETYRWNVQKSAESNDDDMAIARMAAIMVKGGIMRNRSFGMDTSEEDELLAKDGIRIDEKGKIKFIEPKEEE